MRPTTLAWSILAMGTVSLASLAAPVLAESSAPRMPDLGEAMSDTELSDMRGKFVRQDGVSFFGISLLTSWQDAQGITTSARLIFNVDFLKAGPGEDATPVLMIGWERSGDPTMDVTDTHSGYIPILPYLDTDEVTPVGGIGTHQGVAQANVVAGTNNFTRNNMQIAIVPVSAMSGFSMQDLQSADGTTEVGFAEGDQLHFILDNNRVGIVMTGGRGLDSSLQSLGGDIGQILQQTMLNTSGNSVFNSASILLAADNFGQRDNVKIESALSVMKGHGY